nr:hypothetical protein [Endozoicomonas sp.]
MALHRLYGYTISAQIEPSGDTGEEWISHAYAVTPNGKEVDIYGYQDKIDEFSGTYILRENMSEQDIVDVCLGVNFTLEGFELDVQEAIKVINSLPKIFNPNKQE